jgi:hypothetical protein
MHGLCMGPCSYRQPRINPRTTLTIMATMDMADGREVKVDLGANLGTRAKGSCCCFKWAVYAPRAVYAPWACYLAIWAPYTPPNHQHQRLSVWLISRLIILPSVVTLGVVLSPVLHCASTKETTPPCIFVSAVISPETTPHNGPICLQLHMVQTQVGGSRTPQL